MVGGHSLLLIRLRYLIQSRFEIILSVEELLSNLVYSDLKKLIDSKIKSRKYLIFFPALYGECIPYMKLAKYLENRFEIVFLEEFIGETMEIVVENYEQQIRKKAPISNLTFIGASAAGTFAFETSKKFGKVNVILLDSGTYWENINKLNFENHKKDIHENLSKYNIDSMNINQLAESSWKTLQILKNFEPNYHPNFDTKIFVLSIDGTDLGWKK
ncbi:unnamed protein product [Caenorhabditis angaria]|uniref:Uncharacterized protein n=1 Tax=Caenorhabditis angaria TaxID=860376 RepID=A0A9P1IGX1_9PELO|nr:unnamed protein product [Caenorhabditis angaria]